MRYAIFGDVHANIHALQAVLADIDKREVNEIICLGDLVGYAPYPNKVIDVIRERKIATVQGNYDESIGEELPSCGCLYSSPDKMRLGGISVSWTIEHTSEESKEFLRSLPSRIVREVGGKKLLLVHGSPKQINEYLRYKTPTNDMLASVEGEGCDILVCGHTHIPYHRLVSNIHFINAGSAGKPKHGNPNATYTILEVTEGMERTEIIEVPYDYEKTARAIEESELPKEFADMICNGN